MSAECKWVAQGLNSHLWLTISFTILISSLLPSSLQYSWYWTVVFLQFIALLIGLAAQITNKKSRTAAMAMYSTVTALWWDMDWNSHLCKKH